MLAHKIHHARELVRGGMGHRLGKLLPESLVIVRIGGKTGLFARFLLKGGDDGNRNVHGILHVAQKLKRARQIIAETLHIGLFDAWSHAVIKINDALTAVLIVLVGLNGNARQRGIAIDVVGFAQHAVPGGKAVVEQLQQVDLAAGSGEGIEVQIMDVDVPILMCLGVAGIEHVHIIELLCALAAEFQHAAHSGVAVDVGVLTLDIAVHSVLISDILENLHQARVHLAHTAAFRTVEDIGLGGAHKTLFDQYAFHGILHLLDRGNGGNALVAFDLGYHKSGEFLRRFHTLLASARHKAFLDRLLNFGMIKRNNTPVALFDGCDHFSGLLHMLQSCAHVPQQVGDACGEHHHYIVHAVVSQH